MGTMPEAVYCQRTTCRRVTPHIGYVHHPPGLDPADQFFSIANRAGEVRQVHIPEAGYGSCVAASLGAQGPIGWLLSATALAMVRLCRT
jgi:hypothetical protein